MRESQKDTENEQALRRWVTNKLKKDVPQLVWKRVKDYGYVDEALDPNDPYRREDLVDEINELIQFAIRVNEEIQNPLIREGDGRLQRRAYEASVVPTGADEPIHKRRVSYMPLLSQDEASVVSTSADDPVHKRGEAFTLYLAKMAAEDSLVRQFRQRVLDGGTVSYEEAVAFMESPAAAVFPLEWFEKNGVPFIGHKAEVLDGEWPAEEDPCVPPSRIKVEWDGGELVSFLEWLPPFQYDDALLVGAESVWFRELIVLEDSVLGILVKLAQQPWRFPGWEARDKWGIPMFVLMGYRRILGEPYTEHVESRSRHYQPITIKVPPWCPAEKVSEVYKSLKRDFPTTPQPSPRRLALFEFVMKHPEVKVPGEGQIDIGPAWDELLGAWNEALPAGHEWHYDDKRNLRRDFLKAFDQIVHYYR